MACGKKTIVTGNGRQNENSSRHFLSLLSAVSPSATKAVPLGCRVAKKEGKKPCRSEAGERSENM